MTEDVTNRNDHAREFLQGEYTTLRSELIKRAEFRQHLLEITLGSAAAALTLNTIHLTGTEFTRVLLVYPLLVTFLALGWLHQGLRMSILATYIRTKIEPKFRWGSSEEATRIGYETWLECHKRPREQQLGTLASKFMFVVIQVLVLGLGLVGVVAGTDIQTIDMALAVVGVLAIVLTGWFLFLYRPTADDQNHSTP
jgi:hypothetical protein